MNKLGFDLDGDTANNDDNFFGNMERRTNLGQLFGVTTKEDSENPTLKYQPTKQPVATVITGEGTVPQQTWSTQLAKVANAYKEGETVGKVGVALLSNAEGACKIIIYKTKTNILCTLTLQVDSAQMYQQGRYLQYYDDDSRYWSLFFDKQTDEQEFIAKMQEFDIKIQQEVKKADEKNSAMIVEKTTTSYVVGTDESATDSAAEGSKVTHSKSVLISRMAKMGQQLPKFNSINAASTEYDSSDTEVIATPLAMNNKPTIVPRSSKQQAKVQLVPANYHAVVNSAASPMEAQFLQMMLSENRTQNTEMRMNMNKLEGKIEKVLDRMDHMNVSNQNANREDEILALEEKLLELKKENRKLKQALEKKEQRPSIEKSLAHIIQLYKMDLESLDITVDNDIEILFNNMLEKITSLQNNLMQNELALTEKNKQLNAMEQKIKEDKVTHLFIQTKVQKLENTIQNLDKELTEATTECFDAELKKQLNAQALQNEATIKMIMNNLYSSLTANIENSVDSTQKDRILAIIGKTIRAETIKAMQQ